MVKELGVTQEDKAVLVSFEDAISRIKNAKKIVYTGTPVKIVKKLYSKQEKENYIEKGKNIFHANA